MKKRILLFPALALGVALLTGCGAGEQELVSKTPFPEFSETDTEGNIVGAPLIGNVKEQADTLQKRIDRIRGSED